MALDYETLFAALEQAGVRYLLTGGWPRRQDLCDVEALRKMEDAS